MKLSLLSVALFALLFSLGFAQTKSASATDDLTGIEGNIAMAPAQGGPTKKGGPEAKPLAKIVFEVKQAGRVIKSFQTDEQGQFRVALQPGHYTIVRKDWHGAVGFYGPFEVDVTQGKMKKVEWRCDSGLR